MGMESTGGLSVADVAALQNRDSDGMFGGAGGTWIWVFFLFFLLAWGGNGGFGFGNNAATQGALTRADLCQDMNFNDLQNAVRGVQSGLCDGFYAMNTGMLNGFAGTNQTMQNGFNAVENAVTQNRFASQQCCCETNRNIDSVKYENSRNTCDIVNAIKADGDATRALITQNTMQELRDKLQDQKFENSQLHQNMYLINQLQPVSRPAYITCSPYASQNSCLYGACGAGTV
jgi:hypothetical protein